MAGVEIFHLRPGLGELIDDRLNAFAGRGTEISGHLVVRRLHQGGIVEAKFFQHFQRNVFVDFFEPKQNN